MKKTMLVLAVLAMAAMIAAPAFADFYETFDSYSNGGLAGQGGWTGGNAGITVNGGSALLTYDNAYRGMFVEKSGIGVGGAGTTVYWNVDVYFSDAGSWGNAFDIRLEDAAGLGFARWYGGSAWERPRIGDQGLVLGNASLIEDSWNQLGVVVDMSAGTSTFFLNGTNLGSLSFITGYPGIGNVVDKVRIGFQNATTTQNGDQKWYDNIWVGTTPNPPAATTPEPSSFMALGMFGLGALGFIKRRR